MSCITDIGLRHFRQADKCKRSDRQEGYILKIAYTGYPLAHLMGSDPQKKTQAWVQMIAAHGPVDTGPCSTISDRAAMRFLQTVTDITSDLLHIVDDHPQTGTAGDISVDSDQLPRDKAVNIPDMFIYYPHSDSGKENAGPGQIIVVHNRTSSSNAGFPELLDERSVSDLAKAIIRQLSFIDKGIGLKSVNSESMAVRDRFVIFTETTDGMPVISVVRQDPSGRSELLDHDQIRNQGIVNSITKLNSAITAGQPVKTQQSEEFNAGGGHTKVETAAIPAATTAPDTPEAGAPFNITELARAILSSYFSGGKQEDIVKIAENQETVMPNEGAATALSYDAASDTVPGMIIRCITRLSPHLGIPDKTGPGARIIDNLVSLEKLLDDVPGFDPPIDGWPEEDTMALEAVRASIKEKIPVVLRDALQASGRNARSRYPDTNAGPLGINIDENGLLRIDSAALAESLSKNKDETIQYVRDFGNSFQDKIRYDFNPFAGLYSGGESSANIMEPGKKGGGAYDDKRKTEFEKRLNELQLLLKSSYQLKDLFMKSKSYDRPEPFNETDR